MRQLFFILTILIFLAADLIYSQGIGAPLTIQGIDQFSLTGVRSRGMGGSVLAVSENSSAIFSNPALLINSTSLQINVGGSFLNSSYKQTQEWHPDEFYAELSLVIEGTISNVIDTLPQKLSKAYDGLRPDWDASIQHLLPTSFSLSMPFDLFDTKWTVGAGVNQAIMLNQYFQNNNVLDPNLGSYRPSPVIRPKTGDSVKVQWYQFISERSGAVYGYTFGGAVDMFKNFSLGISGTAYDGTSDDLQKRVDRGIFALKTNSTNGFNVMRNDSIDKRVTTTGISDYSGMNGTVAIAYHNNTFTLSAIVNTPLELTRTWTETEQKDSMGISSSSIRNGSDKISIPLQYSFGLALRTSSKVTIGIDYAIHSYTDVQYSSADTSYHPWLSGSYLRAGIEYKPKDWIALRAGFREHVQTSVAEGSGIFDDPVRGSVYTLGCGTLFDSISFDVAYEYSRTEYVDAWESNVNYNTIQSHSILFELGYQF